METLDSLGPEALAPRGDDRRIRRVLIVGGGTAGWMTANLLRRHLSGDRHEICLIESSDVPTIGVGEASVPTLVKAIRALGIDERRWLDACDATFKLGICFDGWNADAPSGRFWHPFGRIGVAIDEVDFFHHWVRQRAEHGETRGFTDFSLQAALCEAGRAPRSHAGPSVVTRPGAYAYHFDAQRLAEFLGERAVAHGVRHIRDHVDHVAVGTDGRIDRILTRSSGPINADLYVDCTGFRGVLIDGALREPWVDDSGSLMCDSAVVGITDPDPAMPPYTRADALGAGWKWRIPLRSRLGHGYVFSSAFTNEDRAADELVERVGDEDGALKDLRTLRFRVGRRRRPWRGNCVAVGLSAGFLEPLESTGIHWVIEAVAELLRWFPDRAFEPLLVQRYNERAEARYSELRDFLVLHYHLSRCDRGPFWRAQKRARVSDHLAEAMALYDATGLAGWESRSLFGDTSFQAIASGSGRLPRRPLPSTAFASLSGISDVFSKILDQNARIARDLPRHADLLAEGGRRPDVPSPVPA